MKPISKYVYKFFLTGEESDVTIIALGKRWHLHKAALQRSDYFDRMFSGDWAEATNSEVSLQFPASLEIDVNALRIIFASFYKDHIEELSKENVWKVVRGAEFLQVDTLVKQCTTKMEETITRDTVLDYYSSAKDHGLDGVANRCLEWLEVFLMLPPCDLRLCRAISMDALQQVLARPYCLTLGERNLYKYLQVYAHNALYPSRRTERHWDDSVGSAQQFFRSRSSGKSFLESDEGRKFVDLFRNINLGQLCQFGKKSYLQIICDKTFPQDWYATAYLQKMSQQQAILLEKHGRETISEQIFDQQAMRFGCQWDEDDLFESPAGKKVRTSDLGFKVIFFLKKRIRKVYMHFHLTEDCYEVKRHSSPVFFLYRLQVVVVDTKHQKVAYRKIEKVKSQSMSDDEPGWDPLSIQLDKAYEDEDSYKIVAQVQILLQLGNGK